ncbi:hypothetical protein SELMODRAFT_439673 [Selaginella moellendorffii]|uniref:Uncharacterized protein n=1 Tax=Selaginella moellendorffii TaxID=88036 RepID=D8R4X2_SELML|nr:hypothetical protein SELMODRAFT_439673 [Selaginella moellendorffii]
METLVLPSQDQLSQHQYWQKRSVMDLFSPRSTPPRYHKADLSSPASRSIQRTSSVTDFSPLSPVALSRTADARPSTASGRLSQNQNQPPKGRSSPSKNAKGNTKVSGKGGNGSNKTKGSKVGENGIAPKPKSKMGFVKKDKGGTRKEESPPKITILQRPQSKEAAMRDLAKITGLPLSEVYAKNGLSAPENAAVKGSSKRADDPVVKAGAGVVAKNRQRDGAARTAKSVKVVKVVAQIVAAAALETKKEEQRGGVLVKEEETTKVATTTTTTTTVDSSTRTTKVLEEPVGAANNNNNNNNVVSDGCGGPFARNFGEAFYPPPLFDEKWAGPAFTNSPPPSSLPIPNFSLRKPEMLAVQAEFARIMDTEAATRGLRRILNLDF